MWYNSFVKAMAATGVIQASSHFAKKSTSKTTAILNAVRQSGQLPDSQRYCCSSFMEMKYKAVNVSGKLALFGAHLSKYSQAGVMLPEVVPVLGHAVNYLSPGYGKRLLLTAATKDKISICTVAISVLGLVVAGAGSCLTGRLFKSLQDQKDASSRV